MAASSQQKRGVFKFIFWAIAAVVVVGICVRSYVTGQMAEWYYHSAAVDGYAVNADTFREASKEKPATLQITTAERIDGLIAVKVKKGERLPKNANGVIAEKVLTEGKRAAVNGQTITVSVPWEIQQAKGFKFKDTFKHKGVETWPWAAVWNVLVVGFLGLTLGLMAEGFTDMMGLKLEKIQHHGH